MIVSLIIYNIIYSLKLEQEMRNLACGDQSPCGDLLVLRSVETEDISY